MFRERRKIRVYLQDGPTIEGILAGRTRREYIIWAPKIVENDESTVEVSGHVEIPRERILWYQVIG